VYASIREYRTKGNAELGRRAEEGFVPIVREISGLSAYYLVDAGDQLFTITVTEDRAERRGVGQRGARLAASEWSAPLRALTVQAAWFCSASCASSHVARTSRGVP
jgi:hypothetical protein